MNDTLPFYLFYVFNKAWDACIVLLSTENSDREALFQALVSHVVEFSFGFGIGVWRFGLGFRLRIPWYPRYIASACSALAKPVGATFFLACTSQGRKKCLHLRLIRDCKPLRCIAARPHARVYSPPVRGRHYSFLGMRYTIATAAPTLNCLANEHHTYELDAAIEVNATKAEAL